MNKTKQKKPTHIHTDGLVTSLSSALVSWSHLFHVLSFLTVVKFVGLDFSVPHEWSLPGQCDCTGCNGHSLQVGSRSWHLHWKPQIKERAFQKSRAPNMQKIITMILYFRSILEFWQKASLYHKTTPLIPSVCLLSEFDNPELASDLLQEHREHLQSASSTFNLLQFDFRLSSLLLGFSSILKYITGYWGKAVTCTPTATGFFE